MEAASVESTAAMGHWVPVHTRPTSQESAQAECPLGADDAGPRYRGGYSLLGLVLGLVILLVVGSFSLGRSTGPSEVSTRKLTTFAATTAAPGASPAPAPERAAEPPAAGRDSPEVGTGFVWGKVEANNDGVLTVHSEFTQKRVVVYSDAETKVYVMIASDPAGIDVGAPVVVYGRKHEDGTITAGTIAGISMHGNTR